MLLPPGGGSASPVLPPGNPPPLSVYFYSDLPLPLFSSPFAFFFFSLFFIFTKSTTRWYWRRPRLPVAMLTFYGSQRPFFPLSFLRADLLCFTAVSVGHLMRSTFLVWSSVLCLFLLPSVFFDPLPSSFCLPVLGCYSDVVFRLVFCWVVRSCLTTWDSKVLLKWST